MDTVSIRELKDRLSEYLRRVRRGGSFFVSRRGEIVAEVRAPYGTGVRPDLDPGLAALAERGSLTPGRANHPELYPLLPPFLPPGAAKRLLDEERGDR